MRLLAAFLLGAATALVAAVPAGALSPTFEPEASLSASPGSVSWPDSTEFQYRLEVKAGSGGLDTTFDFRGPAWGNDRLDGSPVEIGPARLVGPGKLENIHQVIPMVLDLNACHRGSLGLPTLFRLTLGPGEETTVIADARLRAAPLPGLEGQILAGFQAGHGAPVQLAAPLGIGGKQGVLIKTRFAGAGKNRVITRTRGNSFRLIGSTDPAVPHRKIKIRATAISGEMNSEELSLTTVRTDAEGRFRTGKLKVNRTGTWRLSTALSDAGKFDNEPHCAGVVRLWNKELQATPARLDGHTFVSTSVWGRELKQQRIRLRFFRHAEMNGRPKRPTMVAFAGCNRLGALYGTKNGRLRWTGRITGTAKACRTGHDRWLTRLLRGGVRARMIGDQLILNRRKTEIVLQRIR
ncbi:MAG: META domain-containing protein [Actinomycetota bacterium]|nr:META domain-containing protein [Actinomycetota bacterium]